MLILVENHAQNSNILVKGTCRNSLIVYPTGFPTDVIFGKLYKFYRNFLVDFFSSGKLRNYDGTFYHTVFFLLKTDTKPVMLFVLFPFKLYIFKLPFIASV